MFDKIADVCALWINKKVDQKAKERRKIEGAQLVDYTDTVSSVPVAGHCYVPNFGYSLPNHYKEWVTNDCSVMNCSGCGHVYPILNGSVMPIKIIDAEVGLELRCICPRCGHCNSISRLFENESGERRI